MSVLELSPDAASRLRAAVGVAYSKAAARPEDSHAFPLGRIFAESLGYPAELLNRLSSEAVDAFTGVSNVAVFAGIRPGARVLDLGCGAGTDSLIAAIRTGPTGRVVGIDFSAAMLARASRAAAETGLRVAWGRADAERLPLVDASVDVALVNGIFNLNPARVAIFRQLARVVQPGGTVYAAELILREPQSRPAEVSEAEWFG